MIHPRRYSSFASKQQMIVPRGGQTLRLSGFSLLHHKISLILQPRRRCFRLERKNHKKDEKFLRGVSSASISISEFKLLYVTMKLHFWSWNFEIGKLQNSNVIYSDGSWSKFTWIESECDFMIHHLRESWNPWITIFPIFRDFEWKISKFWRDFTRNR